MTRQLCQSTRLRRSFLYVSACAAWLPCPAWQGEDDGSSILAVPAYLDSRDGEKPLGVYAVYDERHALQYVGYSRNMVLAIKVGGGRGGRGVGGGRRGTLAARRRGNWQRCRLSADMGDL